MPARKPPDPNARPLIERFQKTARELGCDEDEEAFKAKLGQIARQKPKVEPSTLHEKPKREQ
jgi:hypothetical protein